MPRPHTRFCNAMAKENTSRPQPRSMVIGRRNRPKLCRVPSASIRTSPPQTNTTTGVRQLLPWSMSPLPPRGYPNAGTTWPSPRDVFRVGGDVPDMAIRVLDRAGAVAVELVFQRPRELGTCRHRLLHRVVHVLHVEMEVDRGAAAGLRREERHAGHFIRQHDVRIADLDLGMAELALRSRDAQQLLRAERTLVEVDRLRRAADAQVRGDGVVSLRDRQDLLLRHRNLLGNADTLQTGLDVLGQC